MTTRIGLVGAGSVAQRHARVLPSLDDVRIAAVADPCGTAAEELARCHGARAFGSAEQMLDAVDVDAVYICVPPFAHGAPEKASLRRGLPMFVEKPLAADLATAEHIAARVEDTGVVTGTGYHWRCLDVVAEAEDLLHDSAPLLACGYWLDKRPPVAWWPHRDRSGGQVIEQLTHVVDLARLLLGEALDVYAVGARRRSPSNVATDLGEVGDVDDATAATVRFTSGAIATLAATSLLDAKHRAALHVFSRGHVVELSETGMIVRNGDSSRQRLPAEDPRVTVDREFIAAVRGEREATRAPYREAVRSHRLGCAVAESARTRRLVTLRTDERPEDTP